MTGLRHDDFDTAVDEPEAYGRPCVSLAGVDSVVVGQCSHPAHLAAVMVRRAKQGENLVCGSALKPPLKTVHGSRQTRRRWRLWRWLFGIAADES